MKTIIRLVLCAFAVIAPAWAAEPLRDAGKVLVLDNQRVLEGEVERVGDQYRVRRSVGETWVPVKQAACVCESMDLAYVHLRGQANLHDPDERLRLAHWCMTNG